MNADIPGGAPAHDVPQLRLEPELRKALEAILLVIDEPVGVDILAQVMEVGEDEVEDGLLTLAAEYVEQGRGFVLRRAGGGWRLYTDPGAAAYVERFVLHGRTGRLSQAALETLAIIAYKQPVSRAEISEIRGVDADSGVRSLLGRGLVEEVGRADSPGQPLLYGTTSSFLEKLGVDDLSELAPLPSLVPDGPPPPEPAIGGYKAARKELIALSSDGAEDGEGATGGHGTGGGGPRPGARLAALMDQGDIEEPEPAPDARSEDGSGAAHETTESQTDPDGQDAPMAAERIQKVLAAAGHGSRRVCEQFIADGRVSVNGRRATLGDRADPAVDVLAVDGERVYINTDLVYLLLNKPVGVVTTASDPEGRPTVMNFVPAMPRTFPVGRLDQDTSGLLLFTNDGELANRITHPRYEVEKTYMVAIRGPVSRRALRSLQDGVVLEDGPARAKSAKVKVSDQNRSLLELVITEGRKREVRRMVDAVGLELDALVRTRIGPIQLGEINPGKVRPLNSKEIRQLYATVGMDGTPSHVEPAANPTEEA